MCLIWFCLGRFWSRGDGESQGKPLQTIKSTYMCVVFLLKQMSPKASTMYIRFTHDYLNEKESRIHSSSEVTHTDDLQG